MKTSVSTAGYRTLGSKLAIGLGAAIVVCGLSVLPSASIAQERDSTDLIAELVETVGVSLVAADQAKDDTERLDDYLEALDRIVYLKALGNASKSPEGEAALQAVASLATEGASTDEIRSLVLSTLYRLIDAEEDQAALRVEVHKQLAAVESDAFRASGYVEFALAGAKGDSVTAFPLLQKAATHARFIEEVEARNSALSAIAQAAASFEGDAAGTLVTQTIAEMSPARTRGFARYVIAQRALSTTDLNGASSNELASAADVAVAAGDLAHALTLALAIDPAAESDRTNALDAVLSAVLEADATELFPVLATAYGDDDDQLDALSQLINDRINADRLLDVLRLTDYLPSGPSRAAVEFALAGALEEAGLSQMAAAAFARGTEVLDALTGVQRDAAVGQAIESALSMNELDIAFGFFDQIRDARQAQVALRRLSKSLSDDDRVEKAKVVLDQITGADDREYALSGIAEAEIKAGNFEAGLAALENISNAEYRGRIKAQLAHIYAKDGLFDDAFKVAAEIEDLAFGVQGYLTIAKSSIELGRSVEATRANELAMTLVEASTTELQRWNLIVEIVGSIAMAGDFEVAETLAMGIPDERLRAKAVGLLGTSASDSEGTSKAMGLVSRVPSAPELDIEITDALVSLSRNPAVLQQVIERVRNFSNDALRVKTFRRIAENQLARLDVFGHGRGTGGSSSFHADTMPPATPAVLPAGIGVARPLYSNGRFSALALSGTPGGVSAFGYPALNKGVADLRKIMPTPIKGNVSVTLASFSPYNGKFLEDLTGGHTGMQVAAAAQGELQPRVVVLESGVYTLGQLADEIVDTGGFSLVQRDGDVVTLRAPVIVGENATLIMSGQEASMYRLSASAGAFIAVAGELFVLDTTVQSWDEVTQAPREATKATSNVFRPFLVGWSGSEINLGGSSFNGLGYAAPKSFGLSFSAGPKELLAKQPDLPNPTGTVVDNVFRNFEYGFYSYEADDVYLVGNQYDDSVVYAIDPHDRSHRLVIGLNTTFGTQNKHGIIVSREVDNSWIVGNVSFDNHGSGLMLDRDSTGTLIYGNVAFANGQDGLTLFESSCNLIAGNDFFSNGRAGIKVRNSWDVGIYENSISDNAEAGVEAYTARIEATSESRDFVLDPYVDVTTFAMGGNDIVGNGIGLKVNGVTGYSVFGKNFQMQEGPLASGDAKGMESFLIGSDGGRAVISQSCLPPRPTYTCPFRDMGIFSDDGQGLGFKEQSGAYCESVDSMATSSSARVTVSR